MDNLMRRPVHANTLTFVEHVQRHEIHTWLARTQKDIYGAVRAVSEILLELPDGHLSAKKRRVLRAAHIPNLRVVLRGYAAALRAAPELGIPAEKFEELAERLSRYENLRNRAGQGVSSLLDLRLLLGAVQWLGLRRVLFEVVNRLESPSTPAIVDARLRSRFSRLLLSKQQVLESREERRNAVADKKAEIEAERSEIEKRTLVLDTIEAIRLGHPVDPQTLKRAALYNRQLKAQSTAPTDKPQKNEERATKR